MTAFPPRHRITDLNLLPLSLEIGSSTSDLLNWGFIEPRPWRNYLHTHSFFEVCYAFEGRGVFRILDMESPVQAGQLFIAKPGEPHEIISSDHDPLGIYFWAYTLARPRDHSPDGTAVDALLTAFMSADCWVSDRVPAVQSTLDLLVEEVVRQDVGYAEAIQGLVLKVLLDTCRSVVPAPIAPDAPPRPRQSLAEMTARHIVTYLQDNYSRPIPIRDVAAQVHLSERHCNRLFRATMGVSIADYLTSVRMDVASRLLLERRLSIKEVAHATGYPDARYFTTLFHHRIGLPPATFRRLNGTQVLREP